MNANEILNDFLPKKIFNAHTHLYDETFAAASGPFPQSVSLNEYLSDPGEIFGKRKIYANIIPFPTKKIIEGDGREYLNASDEFLYRRLNTDGDHAGEIPALPGETEENLLAVRQAALLLDLKNTEIEKLFFYNAERILK